MLMAVLKGSTSTANSANEGDTYNEPKTNASTAYLNHLSLASKAVLRRLCLIPMVLATKLINSCNAPKGHSHPQNVPLPQINKVTATKTHKITVMGSFMKKLKSSPPASASIAAVMFTIVN